MKIPAANPALVEEWASLRAMETCLVETVAEYDEVRNKSSTEKRTAHFGRVFPTSALIGSELAEGDPGWQWKGRNVFQGDDVKSGRQLCRFSGHDVFRFPIDCRKAYRCHRFVER